MAAIFMIVFLFHQLARSFFQSVPIILWHRTISMAFLAPNAYFPLPCISLFSRDY